MFINDEGSVVLPKKGQNLITLEGIVEGIMFAALQNDAIMRVRETATRIYIDFQHPEIAAPHKLLTKNKIGDKALLKAYQEYL